MEIGKSQQILNNYNDILVRDDYLQPMNQKIENRFYPDIGLKPNISKRSISTRQCLFPVEDLRKNDNGKKPYLEYYPELHFAPIQSKPPFKNSDNHLLLENELRGQNTPLHKGDLEIKYLPNVNSELYNVRVESKDNYKQPNEYLFQRPIIEMTKHKNLNDKIGKDLFNNHTRTQLREI